MIKQLITLDFYIMKSLLKTMLLFLLVPILLGIFVDTGTSIIVTLTFIVFMLSTLFSIAEQSNFEKLYGTLPIKKTMYVLSRYLFSLIVLAGTAIISYIIFVALSFIIDGNVHWITGIQYLLVGILISTFFISIQYPFYFYFSFSKAMIMAILPYIIFFALGTPFIQFLMNNTTLRTNLLDLVKFFQSNLFIATSITLILSALFLGVSYFVSVKANNKQL